MAKKRVKNQRPPTPPNAPSPPSSESGTEHPFARPAPSTLVPLGTTSGHASILSKNNSATSWTNGDAPVFSVGTTAGAAFSRPSKGTRNGGHRKEKAETTPMMAHENGNKALPSKATDFELYREKHIRPLMDLNDRVNALTLEESSINATRIVVAGDQSHGKTSLLEALVGVDLPRGEGIQTRVPLVLQLRRSSQQAAANDVEQETHVDEYAHIQVIAPNLLGTTTKYAEKIALTDDISAKVREYTVKAAGNGKAISDIPIQLTIFRRDAQDDLTLVDLPGVTRVALDDQANGDGKKLEEQIMKMCRKYMEPKESILLNVVSAMVDFSTSASLQLSQELDKERKRTLLCITKVDQHSEAGLHDKISKSIHLMKLKPQHVFAVRNRSQKENEDGMPLSEVRRLENAKLEQLTDGRLAEYQLGVKALSKYLVKIQCEEILRTLPQTQNSIKNMAASLEAELENYVEPVGDAAACKAKSVQLIDACTNRLEGEASGRIPTELSGIESCEGQAFELTLVVDDFMAAYEKGGVLYSPPVEVGNLSFQLHVHHTKGHDEGRAVGLRISTNHRSITANVDVSCTFTALHQDVEDVEKVEIARYHMECQYCLSEKQLSKVYGNPAFLSSVVAQDLFEEVTFHASVFVESVHIENASTDQSRLGGTLLCARLSYLQDELTTNINKLYSNTYFFSTGFRKSLARDLQASRGGIGLPGNIASHVPVGVLRKLRTKLPVPIAEYRSKVLEECAATAGSVIKTYVGVEHYPKLHSILVECVQEILDKQVTGLKDYHEKILEWEENICSSNHYFMDTVNSIRSSVYDSGDEDDTRPSYLQHLTSATIAEMSNEDQKLVDLQIEIFAYWKLMKKRLIDYVLLSTQSELVSIPIHKKLKSAMLDVVFHRNDEQVVQLLSPDSNVEKARAMLVKRLEKLTAALQEIDEYKSRHPGGLVEID